MIELDQLHRLAATVLVLVQSVLPALQAASRRANSEVRSTVFAVHGGELRTLELPGCIISLTNDHVDSVQWRRAGEPKRSSTCLAWADGTLVELVRPCEALMLGGDPANCTLQYYHGNDYYWQRDGDAFLDGSLTGIEQRRLRRLSRITAQRLRDLVDWLTARLVDLQLMLQPLAVSPAVVAGTLRRLQGRGAVAHQGSRPLSASAAAA
jgi:hypothetical protein